MKCPFTANPGNVGAHCWGSEAEPSRSIPSVWDEVCKAFTQRGADPDLALGALSQEKSLLENSQWLLCVRSEELSSASALPSPGNPGNVPLFPLGRSRARAPEPQGISVLAAQDSAAACSHQCSFGG